MKTKATATILSIILTASLLGLMSNSKPTSATPTTIEVPSPLYKRIQAAIDDANPNDTILVKAGIYRENLEINKAITLKGSGQNVTTIEAKVDWKVVIEIKSNNVNISGFTIQGGSSGISILGFNASKISDNKIISNTGDGIELSSSHNNVIFSNVISLNGFDGVLIDDSSNNLIYDNVVADNLYFGIDLFEAHNNRISNNTVSFNRWGISPMDSNGNTFDGNTLFNNTYGVSILQCQNNVFHHNNFINNTYQVDTFEAVNSWNTTAKGNYWSDYSGQDGDGNGIGDTPYVIDETNQDNFPLMSPWIPPKDVTPPVTTDDYYDMWHTEDFKINLMAFDLSGIKETYYKINGGEEKNVSANGQPFITQESPNNTLEYWSVDNVGINESHNVLTGIKLDKTAPLGSIQINNGDACTTSLSVTLNLSATDDISGIAQMHFSNDNTTWSPLEPYSTSKAWNLTSMDGPKTVYVIYVNNAGLNSPTYDDSIVLDTGPPTIFVLYPNMGAQMRSQNVTINWSGADAGSGIDHYEIALDAGSFTVNVTEQTYTISGLSDGNHIVTVRAFDRIGRSSEASVTFVVNTSPLGGPGYLEEAILTVIVIIAIGIIAYILRVRKKHQPKRELNLSAKT